MSLFYNNYQRLRQENADEIAHISEDSWNAVWRMMEYMKSFPLSLFEMEVVKKDLIGIAREAELEGIPFSDKLGMPEKEFCENLLREEPKTSRWERILPAMRNFSLLLLFIYSLNFFFDGCPDECWISYGWLLLAGGAELYDCLLKPRLVGRTIYEGKGRRMLVNALDLCIYFAVTTLAVWLPDKYRFISGNGWAIFAVLLALVLLSFFGNNYFWDKRSEQYAWK